MAAPRRGGPRGPGGLARLGAAASWAGRRDLAGCSGRASGFMGLRAGFHSELCPTPRSHCRPGFCGELTCFLQLWALSVVSEVRRHCPR